MNPLDLDGRTEKAGTPTSPGESSSARLGSPFNLSPPEIPDYELVKRIGQGSYGEVWLARNVLGTYYAVKIVYRQTFESDRPFEREFEGIQRFEPISRLHESQITILHVGRKADYFYYVMELADDSNAECGMRSAEPALTQPADTLSHPMGEGRGEGSFSQLTTLDPLNYIPRTLRSELKQRGRLPFEECLQIALKLTEALGHLHQRGLVHRDIKPSNVIFVNGRPKLADIGLVAGTEATLSFVGTEGYLPPEGPGKPPADIYSLGKVIYEISTGRDRNEYPELPSLWKSEEERDGFAELNEVILRACASDLKRRYAGTDPMHEDLVLIQAGKSLRRSRALQRRFRWVSRAATLLAALSAVITGGYLLQRHQTRVAKRLTMQLQVQSGIRLLEDDDAPGALLWFAEALAGAERFLTAQEKEAHRFRLGAVLRECPRLLHALPHEGGDQGRTKVAISRDGRRLVTARYDHAARVWDLDSGALLATLAHSNFVSDAAISPDGRGVATASRDGTARLWVAETGAPIGSALQHETMVGCVAISPDGHRVATASYDKTARVWDSATGQPVTPPLAHDEWVKWVAFSPDGKRLVTATRRDGPTLTPEMVFYAQVWDAATGAKLAPPLEHSGNIFQAIFSPDGGRVLTVSWDGTVRVWNAATSAPILPPLRHRQPPQHAEFSPDGQQILTIEYMGGLHLWDAITGEEITPPFEKKGEIISATFSPDGSRIAGLHNQQVLVWDAVTGQRLLPPLQHNDRARGLAFSPDGFRLVTAGHHADPVVRVWDLSGADAVMPLFKHHDSIVSAEFSPDGRRVLTSSLDGTAQVWDAATGQPVAPVIRKSGTYGPATFSPDGTRVLIHNPGHNVGNGSARVWDATTSQPISPEWKSEWPMPSALFSPDGQRVVTASGPSPPRPDVVAKARVWDAVTGAPLSPPMEFPGDSASASFSPDGRKVVTGSFKGIVQIWDATTAERILPPIELGEQAVEPPQFSPDSQKLFTVKGGGVLQVWDANTGKAVTGPLRHVQELSAAWSPDSRWVVGWCAGTAQVWDATTGERVGPQLRHQAIVSSAAFSPDSRRVVTASDDHTAQIWDPRSGLKLSPPLQHHTNLTRAIFSPDGRRVLTACVDGTARVWEFPRCNWPVEDLRLLAQALSGRSIDATGNAVALAPEVLQAALAKLRSKQPHYFRKGAKVTKTTH